MKMCIPLKKNVRQCNININPYNLFIPIVAYEYQQWSSYYELQFNKVSHNISDPWYHDKTNREPNLERNANLHTPRRTHQLDNYIE